MSKSLKIFITAMIASVSFVFVQCTEKHEDGGSYTVVFDTQGGSPQPQEQIVERGAKAIEPEAPVLAGYNFIGWFTPSGLKFNFSTPITSDIVLTARWWQGPEQYVFLQDYDWEFNYDKIKAYFGDSEGESIAIGRAFIIYIFERDRELMIDYLKKHLQNSADYNIPVLVQLDPITFMTSRPDLWNWWDDTAPGYDPDNRNNVEWTSWSPEDAVKIGWLNWGSQIRLNPMPNLMSPEYRQAVMTQMTELITIVKDWYDSLPEEKKYLLGGIKVTGEMAIGVNNWYYPDGNKYVGQPEENDPQTGINMYDLPSRGVQTIGYAALKTGGFKDSGEITGHDIAVLAQKHSEYVSKIAHDLGFPREKIFAHAGGCGEDLEACINEYASPSWSFYLQDAANPAGFTDALNILETSDAPYFGVAEWSIGDNQDPAAWTNAISEALGITRCRYLSVYANVVGNSYYGTTANQAAIQGIKALQQ